MTSKALASWHAMVKSRDPAALDAVLADDVVFHSPVVHTPQQGRAITRRYLAAALQVFINDSFRYRREFVSDTGAALEFTVEIDGLEVNGVDILTWNADGRITEFKVMLRPLQAVRLIHAQMGALLGQSRG